MRPWSTHVATFLCAPGRYHAWRCDRCAFHHVWVESALSGLPPSISGLLEVRREQAAELAEQFAELAALPRSGALAATVDKALSILCIQQQFVAESIDALARLAAATPKNEFAVAMWQLRSGVEAVSLPWRSSSPAVQA